MSTRILITALFATALTMPALAQSETPPAPAAVPPAAAAAPAAVQGSEPAANSVSRDKDTLSVDFPDEDIKTILRNVADLFELNLVVPDTLTGKTSIKLRDVTWRQIFHVVLAPAGYTYIEEGNIIKVVSNESLQLEPTATDVLILNNAKAADILPTIAGMIDASVGGKILVDARSNALVITERPSRMGRIRQTIELLDKATDQVMIESKFVEVTDRDIHNIGVNWASLSGVELGARNLSQTFSRGRDQTFTNGTNGTTNTNNTTNGTNQTSTSGSTTSGTSTNVNNSTNSSTSGTPPVTTVTSQGSTSTNTSGTPAAPNTSNNGSSLLSNSATNSVNSAVNVLNSLTNGGSTSRLASAVFSASDFKVILSALKTQNNTKIVSNPTVVTLNNSEATLNIGSEFPIPSYTYNSERGSFEVSGFTYKPIGINLKVTPQVNSQGLIRLNLEPEVSQTNGNTTFGGANIPVVATRKVKTQISLKDGYTAGIGGLIQVKQDHGNTKVPVLGSIPGLGRLFSSKSVNDETTNLLIFITARTVNSDGADPVKVFQSSALEAVGMSDVGKK